MAAGIAPHHAGGCESCLSVSFVYSPQSCGGPSYKGLYVRFAFSVSSRDSRAVAPHHTEGSERAVLPCPVLRGRRVTRRLGWSRRDRRDPPSLRSGTAGRATVWGRNPSSNDFPSRKKVGKLGLGRVLLGRVAWAVRDHVLPGGPLCFANFSRSLAAAEPALGFASLSKSHFSSSAGVTL